MSETRRLPSPFVRLVLECLRFRGLLAISVLALAGQALAALALTWLLKQWLEGPFLGGDTGALFRILWQAFVVTLVLVVLLFVSRYAVAGLNQRLLERLRDAAVGKLLRARVPSARRRPSGELLSRVFSDTSALSGFVETFLKRIVADGLDAAGSIVILFFIDARLASAAALFVPVLGVLLARIGRTIRRWGALAQADAGGLSATLNEQLHGLTTIKGHRAEEFEIARFAEQNARYRRRSMRAELWSSLLLSVVFLGTGLGLLGLIAWGSWNAASFGAGRLLAFGLFAARTIEPLRRLSEMQGVLQRSLASAARVYEVIDEPEPETGGSLALPRPVLGEMRLEGVRFRHAPDRPLLEGLDLVVPARQSMAIVAGSGEGKSTLACLMLRLMDPDAGRLMLDGIDLHALSLVELRQAVCVVEQEPFVFSGPVAENLRYGARGTSVAAIREAVRLAGLEEWIAALPEGLDTVLTEAGRNLSGGQKQRIALARAILCDPRLLVLDEATSALDSETEAQIFSRLSDWLGKRTVIVMAHRLSTVSRFERVVVLEAGRIVGDGTASELLDTCPVFSTLFAEQVGPLGTLAEVAR
jgi:ATP-binding cassette, subfamily B, bacterial